MIGASPPEKEEAPRVQSRGQKINGFEERVSAEPASCNSDRWHELMERQGEVFLFRFPNGRASSFEVVFGNQRWSFTLEYSARSKFDRLIRSQGGRP
jgi:hypothetical protein